MAEPEWHLPRDLAEARELRARLGDRAPVVAGGTFTAILVNQGLLRPAAFLYLGGVPDLDRVAVDPASGELVLGPMVRHRQVERSDVVRRSWPALAATFGQVGSPRVRNQATVGGVLCDADYASDPPTMLSALGARVRLAGPRGEREVPVADLILDHYTTQLTEDELLVELRVPRQPSRASYLKFRTRSSEDRPCVGVAAAADFPDGRCRGLQVVVGAVSGRPRSLPEACAVAEGERLTAELAAEIGRRYGERLPTLSDVRSSASYRSRVLPVLVRRALEDLVAGHR